jgi:hypothetical protein
MRTDGIENAKEPEEINLRFTRIWLVIHTKHFNYNFSANPVRYSILNFKQKHFHNWGESLRAVLFLRP